jgi:hypothetical protein
MKKNFLPFRDHCARQASRPAHVGLPNPLHEASRLLSSAAQGSSGWAGAKQQRVSAPKQRHQKSVGNVALASPCFDNGDLNRRAPVWKRALLPSGGDDDKGSEGSKDSFAAKGDTSGPVLSARV